MYFANPWGLLGLLALPAIAVIHLYHRRFPPLVVGGLHLWGAETETRSAGRRRERLPITATLLLELLAALMLTLVLSQPRLGQVGDVTHLVVVMDNSASMTAAPAGGPSFWTAAIQQIEDRVAQLERGSVVTVILTGRRPAMLAGPAVPWEEASAALKDWRPSAPEHDFQPAWDLASQLAADTGRLLFLSDHLPPRSAAIPQAMEIISVGRSLDNVAITAARWTFDTAVNTGRVYVRVHNFGRNDAQVTVRGRTDQRIIFSRNVAIRSGRAIPLETEVPGGLGQLTIEAAPSAAGVSTTDGLRLDNQVVLVEPKIRLLSVAVTLPPDDPATRPIQRVLDALPDIQPADAESAQLVIGPAGELPPSRRDLWWLGVGPIDRSERAREAAKDLSDRNPYLIEKRNPLLEGVVLGGVVWGGVQPLDLNVTPLISAGPSPLLAQLNGTQTTAYVLNIDLARSNLPESPDWPILLGNLIALRRDNLPGLRRWNYRLNEEIRFRLFEGAGDPSENDAGNLTLVHGERERPLARTPVVEVPPLQEPGVYDIRDGDRTVGRFAVNFFDNHESQLLALSPESRPPELESQSATFSLDNPYSWLILLAIALTMLVVFLDWIVLKPKRMTTGG